jgi:hypothetical protein
MSSFVVLVTHYVLSGKHGQHQDDHAEHDKPQRRQLHLRSAPHLPPVFGVSRSGCPRTVRVSHVAQARVG